MSIFSGYRLSAAVAVLLGMTLVGCRGTDDLPREAVSGIVAMEGKPIETGMLILLPDGPDVSTQGGGVITDSKYAIPCDQDLVPGKYKVVISAGGEPEKPIDTKSNNDMPGMPPVPSTEILPPTTTRTRYSPPRPRPAPGTSLSSI